MRPQLTLLCVLVLAGCYATTSIDSMTTFEAERSLSMDTLALLPVRSSGGYEGFNRTSEAFVEDAIRSQRPSVTLVTAQQARSKLSEADLADDLSSLVENYRRTGILDQGTLRDLGETLQAGHILHVAASYDELPYENEFRQEVRVEGRIWSVGEGDVIWEGSATADNPVEGDLNPEEDPRSLIRRTVEAFVAEIP